MTRLTTLACALLFGATASYAQITVTDADFGSVGESVILARDTMPAPGTTAGASGANQTWDYTGLSLNSIDTVDFINPGSTTNGAVFPSADMAVEAPFEVVYFGITNLPLETAPDINYYQLDANAMILQGYSIGVFGVGDIPIKFTPPITQFEFPMNYLDSWSDTARLDTTFDDTFSGGLSDSIRAIRHSFSTVNVDSWGSLTTSNGTYDVLRQHREEITIDTVWTLLPIIGWQIFQTQVDTLYTYSWIANGEFAGEGEL